MTGSDPKKLKSKILVQTLSGFVAGVLGMTLFLACADEPAFDLDNPSTVLAALAGVIYAVMGLGVGLGVIAPRAGARFLNVEDEEELREERRSLGPSAAACFLIGLFFLVLALAPDPEAAAGGKTLLLVALASLAALLVISIAVKDRGDELVRQIGVEASALTMHVTLLLLSVWATFAHFGYVAWVEPVALIAGLALLELAAIFRICAKKGLMKPR